jgi:hypothetical protein
MAGVEGVDEAKRRLFVLRDAGKMEFAGLYNRKSFFDVCFRSEGVVVGARGGQVDDAMRFEFRDDGSHEGAI